MPSQGGYRLRLQQRIADRDVGWVGALRKPSISASLNAGFRSSTQPTTLFEYNLRFPGQFYDKETGLHYNTFRDYDPVTGRYVDSDPMGLAGGLNTYAYVGGNPVDLVDPLGLYGVAPDVGRVISRLLIPLEATTDFVNN